MAKQRNAGGSRQEFHGRIVTPRIGAHWDGHGGLLLGIIRGAPDQPDYCVIGAPPAVPVIKGHWGPGARIEGALSDVDGMANTKAMAAAGSEVAKRALAVEYQGHKDYYIASRNEARIAYASGLKQWGTGWLWTSTQCAGFSDWAWYQYFGYGYQDNDHKSYEAPVLLVRRVPIR
jgi:hypothetical protein